MGHKEDLEEAIQLHRDSLLLCPLGHPGRSISLYNLANALQIRFEQTGSMENLNEALKHYEQALFLRSPGHPERSN
jgi:2-phospho-L-lactate guanylyltransferase (CobY/MobA/RfbA family)